ncbi:MAG: hypothetical protein N2112_15685, partial [Gemmataceae bacterium]|nr:hypothetical protein [Gemmataceae bacterium]
MLLTEPKRRRFPLLLHVVILSGCLLALGAESTGTSPQTFEFTPFNIFNEGIFSTVELLGLFVALGT